MNKSVGFKSGLRAVAEPEKFCTRVEKKIINIIYKPQTKTTNVF